MSASFELQSALFEMLQADAGVSAIVGDRVYDAVPSDITGEDPYITFGPSSFVDDSAECIVGRAETVQLDCWSIDQGRLNPCKKLVDAVCRAVRSADLQLETNALVSLNISLARVFIDADGITAHGIVQVRAHVEEY